MRVFLALYSMAVATAFSPLVQQKKSGTQLAAINRRDLITGLAGVVLAPQAVNALSHGMQNREGSHTHGSTFFFKDEDVREESQMSTGGKLDLNGATVVSSLLESTFGRSEASHTPALDSNPTYSFSLTFLH